MSRGHKNRHEQVARDWQEPVHAKGASALKMLLASEREVELAWLKEAVYAGKSVGVELETFDARTRYSGRDGQKERVRV